MSLVVYGIPTCGTVKKARAFLDVKGWAHQFTDFRAAPPALEKIQGWVKAFGAQAMKNTSGGSYRALAANKDNWSEDQWIAAFAADPMLIKRPIIERDGKPVLVGFRDVDVSKLG